MEALDEFIYLPVGCRLYYMQEWIEWERILLFDFHWCAFDDFEWGLGYTPRFGFYFIDYNNLTRIPKEPAKGFHDFLKSNTTNYAS